METIYKERKMLKKIVKRSKKTDKTMLDLYDLNIDLDDYYLSLLSQHKFVSRSFGNGDQSDRPHFVHLNESGRYFFEYRWNLILEFIAKSIATPIIVSVITTGVLWFIGWLTGLVR